MKSYKINGRLTPEMVQQYNILSQREPIQLVFENTRGINAEIVKMANNNIRFSVQGGLTPT